MIALIQSFLPKRGPTIAIIVGFALGLVWAYVILPTMFFDADASQLEQSYQDEWVRGLAARYETANADQAQVDNQIGQLLAQIDDPLDTAQRIGIQDQGFLTLAQQAQNVAPAAPPRPTVVNNIVLPIVAVIGFAIVYIVLAILWALLLWPFFEPLYARLSRTRDADGQADQAAKMIQKIKDDKAAQAAMLAAAPVEETGFGDPVIRKLSNYQAGFGNYDDSFNIETEDKVYYGECGATIGETLPDSDKVTAIEVWMFDKDEFVNTPTVTFVSTHSMGDQAMIQKFSAKGEVLELKPGATAILETAALYVKATVQSVTYGDDATFPSNSYFENASIQIIAWYKGDAGSGASAPATVPAPVMPAMAGDTMPAPPAQPPPQNNPMSSGGGFQPPPQGGDFRPPQPPPGGGFQPPPQQPSQGDFRPPQPPPGGGFQPPQPPPGSGSFGGPPPASNPSGGNRPSSDDPFGGSGDF